MDGSYATWLLREFDVFLRFIAVGCFLFGIIMGAAVCWVVLRVIG